MKIYTFLDQDEKIIEEVRAENHDMALRLCTDDRIKYYSDFYSSDIND
jgi:hypothetical protein